MRVFNPRINRLLSREYRLVSSVFDDAFYRRSYPDICRPGVDPLAEFLDVGWREGRDPNEWFSVRFYRESNPELNGSDVNPVVHYLDVGFVRGLRTHPGQERTDSLPLGRAHSPGLPHGAPDPALAFADESSVAAAIENDFEADFYVRQLASLGLELGDLAPVEHYLRIGVHRGAEPAAGFSGGSYLAANPDVAQAGVNPFWHFVVAGRAEDRPLRPRFGQAGEFERELVAPEFDENYYLLKYPDVAQAGLDPLQHFLERGWRTGYNPNDWFSVSDYLEMYPDIGQAGCNPFTHFVQTGRGEGRHPKQELGFRYDVIQTLVPLAERVANARRWIVAHPASETDILTARFRELNGPDARPLFLSVSHDNFTVNLGGVQLCLQREAEALRSGGFEQIHLFPDVALPMLEVENPEPNTGVLVGGELVGYFSPSAIIEAVEAAGLNGRTAPSFAIHSLLGHSPTAIVRILKSLGAREGYFWVHDFTAACTGFHLMRNDVQFCGGPPVDSVACGLCVYGSRRVDHLEAHRYLFEELSLSLLAPSEFALDLWKRSTGLRGVSERVQPHCRLVPAGGTDPAEDGANAPGAPLRVAFAGLPTNHKGWPVFKALATAHARDPRYAFYHLAVRTEPLPSVRFEEVAVTPSAPDEMRLALERLEIDVVVLWSICPETFCFTAYEATAAGATLITMSDGGNAARLAASQPRGIVLRSEDELMDLFASGEGLSSAARGQRYTLAYGGGTADVLEGRVS